MTTAGIFAIFGLLALVVVVIEFRGLLRRTRQISLGGASIPRRFFILIGVSSIPIVGLAIGLSSVSIFYVNSNEREDVVARNSDSIKTIEKIDKKLEALESNYSTFIKDEATKEGKIKWLKNRLRLLASMMNCEKTSLDFSDLNQPRWQPEKVETEVLIAGPVVGIHKDYELWLENRSGSYFYTAYGSGKDVISSTEFDDSLDSRPLAMIVGRRYMINGKVHNDMDKFRIQAEPPENAMYGSIPFAYDIKPASAIDSSPLPGKDVKEIVYFQESYSRNLGTKVSSISGENFILNAGIPKHFKQTYKFEYPEDLRWVILYSSGLNQPTEMKHFCLYTDVDDGDLDSENRGGVDLWENGTNCISLPYEFFVTSSDKVHVATVKVTQQSPDEIVISVDNPFDYMDIHLHYLQKGVLPEVSQKDFVDAVSDTISEFIPELCQ